MNKGDLRSWRKTITNDHSSNSEAQLEPATVQNTVEKRVVRFVEPEKEKNAPAETRRVRFTGNQEAERVVRFVETPGSPERKVTYRECPKAPSKVQKAKIDNSHRCGAKPTESASAPPLIDLETPPPSPQTPLTPPDSPASPLLTIPTAPPPPVISRPRTPSPGIEDLAPDIWIEFASDDEAQEEGCSELKIVKVESLYGTEAAKFI